MHLAARLPIVGLLLAVAAALAVGPAAVAAPAAPSRFQAAPCTALEFKAEDLGAGVECGWLHVPERWDRGRTRQLKLAVVIARATEARRDDPVLYIHGGPGIATLDVVPRALRGKSWPGLRRTRDLIFMDFRGTGRSTPLVCPQTDALLRELPKRGLGPRADADAKVEAARACRAALLAEGGDPAAYNARTMARDFVALRQALRVKAWNIFATSYGTLPAVEMVRMDIDGVRALVLDSAFAPNAPNRAEQMSITAAGVAALQARCDATPACRARHPDIMGDLVRAVVRLDAAPLASPAGPIDGETFVEAIWTALVFGETAALAPGLASRAANGDDDLVRTFAGVFGAPDTFGGAHFAQGWLANCHDNFDRPTAPAFRAAIARWPHLGAGVVADEQDRICRAIGAGAAGEAWRRPLRRAPPTLVLFGEYDPATSRGDALAAVAYLPGARLVEIAGASHAPFYTDDCTRGLVGAFLANPGADPDRACLGTRVVKPIGDPAAIDAFLAELSG